MRLRRGAAAIVLASIVLAGATGFSGVWDRRLPRIVFVSRLPLADGRIAGLGPAGRTAAPGGELMVRERSGRVRALLPAGTFHDVADPNVSWDGRRIAFAATVHADSAWRIWLVDADGARLERLTGRGEATARAPGGAPATRSATDGARRFDDFDPCWLPDGRIVFASTRFHQVSQLGGYPVSNLFVIGADGAGLIRLTTERNGAEAPSIDPRDGRIVYARWWFNRYLPSDTPPGVTLERAHAVPSDTVDLWHAVSIATDGDGIRLAGGDPRERSGQMAYAPLLLRDGTLIGVQSGDASLAGPPGALRLVDYPGGFAERRVLGSTSAFAPALLPDGRIVCSMDVNGTGDFALCVMDPAHPELARAIADRPGRIESGAAVLAPRPAPPVLGPGMIDPPGDAPHTEVAQLHDHVNTFRFDCLNVFATGPVDSRFPDAPPMQQGVKIRFFATLSRPAATGGDTVVLVREAALTPTGAVHEDDMPADVPMFEQLVDREGKVLRSATGPAHVPGLNFARLGSGTKCVGCHAGHSALDVPSNYTSATWVNASPSARVTASSRAPGAGPPEAVIDRRARGAAPEPAWEAVSDHDEWVRLEWGTAIEVRSIVLYACGENRMRGTDLRIDRTRIRMFRSGREVATVTHDARLRSGGSRIDIDPREIDALEVHPLRTSGAVRGRRAVALAEIETIARLAYDTTP
jgi:hypothetical protein